MLVFCMWYSDSLIKMTFEYAVVHATGALTLRRTCSIFQAHVQHFTGNHTPHVITKNITQG